MTVRNCQSIMFILCHIVLFYVSLSVYLFIPLIFSTIIWKYFSNTKVKAESETQW